MAIFMSTRQNFSPEKAVDVSKIRGVDALQSMLRVLPREGLMMHGAGVTMTNLVFVFFSSSFPPLFYLSSYSTDPCNACIDS